MQYNGVQVLNPYILSIGTKIVENWSFEGCHIRRQSQEYTDVIRRYDAMVKGMQISWLQNSIRYAWNPFDAFPVHQNCPLDPASEQ